MIGTVARGLSATVVDVVFAMGRFAGQDLFLLHDAVACSQADTRSYIFNGVAASRAIVSGCGSGLGYWVGRSDLAGRCVRAPVRSEQAAQREFSLRRCRRLQRGCVWFGAGIDDFA